MIPERCDIPPDHKWDVEAFYDSTNYWEKDFKSAKSDWANLQKYKGKLHQPKALKEALSLFFNIDRMLSRLYTYAHLRFDEDLGNDGHKNAYSRIQTVYFDFQTETSWMEPEILEIQEQDFVSLLNSKELKPYKNYLEKLKRLKKHTLSEAEEELLALSAKSLSTSHKAFSSFNNADLKFEPAVDEKGKSHDLSQGLYNSYMKSKDRHLRKSAYENLLKGYLKYENTLAELLSGQVQNHIFVAKAKKYKSALDAALYTHNINLGVYKNLIETVKKNIHVLYKYISFRKKVLGVKELHPYDLHVPLTEETSFNMTYEQAKEVVLESVQPLGNLYCDSLEKGLYEQRWVDVYENQRKRSGAYSSGCYDSYPYILLNFHGTLNDVFTLAHEAGHSMHSHLSNEHQSFIDAQYPIFVAEVASTFNEQLLLKNLLQRSESKKEQVYLINYAIEAIRGTLFRQTLFAEFELKIHEWAEEGVPLTAAFLKKEYHKLYEEYYGPDLVLDDLIEIEWARIPHFYYNFYVYQYATGISAAISLVEGVLDNSPKLNNYLTFLSSGCAQFPLDLLKTAGVDMTKPGPIQGTLSVFEELVDELEELLSSETDSELLIK